MRQFFGAAKSGRDAGEVDMVVRAQCYEDPCFSSILFSVFVFTQRQLGTWHKTCGKMRQGKQHPTLQCHDSG